MGRPAAGYQLANGQKVPGTTTITSRFSDKGGIINWAHAQGLAGLPLYEKRDEAADIGTFIHEMWEARLRETQQPQFPRSFTDDMQLQAWRSLGAAVRWLEDSHLKITPFEEPLVSEKYQFGGTPDALAKGTRGNALVDWKSSSGIYLETWLQMAAYLELLEETRPEIDLSDGVHIVRFDKKGGLFSHTHIPRDHPGLVLALDQFIRFVDAYSTDKELKKLI